MLRRYPDDTAIFTVRDATDTDVNTNGLRQVTSKIPDSKVSTHEVDLTYLAAVHKFATALFEKIAGGTYSPLKAIICNAFYWNLVPDRDIKVDGSDDTMQINFVSHALGITAHQQV